MLSGKHLINGRWIDGGRVVESSTRFGNAYTYCEGTPVEVELAAAAAEAAFASFAAAGRAARAAFLDRIADELERLGAQLTAIGSAETGLPEARLTGERGRTIGQLRLFARHIEAGDYLDRRFEPALPDRAPAPRPDLRLMQRPLGPVAVFGASNFPLAFSVAGGDTASAFAAGCPVVVKGHPAHPATGELVAQAIDEARRACDLHPGVFSFVQAGTAAASTALVQHPLICAVGFTGSLGVGRTLFNLCAARPEPIPFYGEFGAINPVFVLEGALRARGGAIAQSWAESLTLGVGQFCTNPGVVIVVGGDAATKFASVATEALRGVAPQRMLTEGIADAYRSGAGRVAQANGVERLVAVDASGPEAGPALLRTKGDVFLANPILAAEVFGPLGLIVEAADLDQMIAIASALEGQLTVTLQIEPEDHAVCQQLLPVLERKAGRLLANGFPTGVEVSDAMSHGGPYPASTNVGATSVGTMAIRRFLRLVCYQDLPAALLPPDLFESDRSAG